MIKRVIIAVATLLLAANASAQDRRYPAPAPGDGAKVAWADVLRVDPIYDKVRVSQPRQECYQQPVERVERGNSTGATVLGAIIGGALGNQVGKGDGRRAATVAGAVIGGAVGNNTSRGGDRYYNDTETRCRTVDEVVQQRQVVGYDVEYRYRGDVYVSRLDYDPGERLRVRVSVTPAD